MKNVGLLLFTVVNTVNKILPKAKTDRHAFAEPNDERWDIYCVECYFMSSSAFMITGNVEIV